MSRRCEAGCGRTTDHTSGFCSDTCLQSMTRDDAPPVIVLARNKAGGFGSGLNWRFSTPVIVRDPDHGTAGASA